MYKPSAPFNVSMMVLVPTFENVNGVPKKVYQDTGTIVNGSFRTFGGSEKIVNGVLTLENTAVVETFYTPTIKADCRIKLLDFNDIYEIMGEPENIELRNQFLKFKVKKVGGRP